VPLFEFSARQGSKSESAAWTDHEFNTAEKDETTEEDGV
jgi:hypothetical protein